MGGVGVESELFKTIENAFSGLDYSRLILCGAVLFGAIVIYIALRIGFKKYRKKLVPSDDVRRQNAFATVRRVANILLVFVTALLILQILGINVSSIVLSFGLISTILAFAVKDALQDVFTGLMIRTDNFFKVGDAVEFNGKDGIVVAFSIRSTKIEFLDDRSVLSVANRNIDQIRSLTHLVDIDLPLSYDESREKVYEVLENICGRIRATDGIEDCMFKGTQRFDESAIIYKIRFFCEPNDRPDISRAVHKIIQDGLEEADIRIPFRQLDIHQK